MLIVPSLLILDDISPIFFSAQSSMTGTIADSPTFALVLDDTSELSLCLIEIGEYPPHISTLPWVFAREGYG